jgi:hypothetical protein
MPPPPDTLDPLPDWLALDPLADWLALDPPADWLALDPPADWLALDPPADWLALDPLAVVPPPPEALLRLAVVPELLPPQAIATGKLPTMTTTRSLVIERTPTSAGSIPAVRY